MSSDVMRLALVDARQKLKWFVESYPHDLAVNEAEFFGQINQALEVLIPSNSTELEMQEHGDKLDRKSTEELNCAEDVLDALSVNLDMDKTDFECIGEYITAVFEAQAKKFGISKQEPVAVDITIDDDDALSYLRDMVVQSDGDLTPIRLLVGDGHSGYGLYIASADYPEEGAVKIADVAAIKTATQPKAEQESPAAWRRFAGLRFEYIDHIPALDGMVSEEWKPLYTTPPQRNPLGNVLKVERTSDQSVLVVFRSCRAASEFETEAAHGIAR